MFNLGTHFDTQDSKIEPPIHTEYFHFGRSNDLNFHGRWGKNEREFYEIRLGIINNSLEAHSTNSDNYIRHQLVTSSY